MARSPLLRATASVRSHVAELRRLSRENSCLFGSAAQRAVERYTDQLLTELPGIARGEGRASERVETLETFAHGALAGSAPEPEQGDEDSS